jgi:2-keto-4-pentenoate hydratase
MTTDIVVAAAHDLWDAETSRRPIDPLSGRTPPITPELAYDVQLRLAETRRQLGHRVVGKKIGVTSAAMQRLAGVMEPDYGHLFDVMDVPAGMVVARSELIAPKVEPELAFVLGARLPGASTRPADVLRCTEFVTAGIEIVDTRIKDWKITWADTVADNGSSARFVLAEAAASPKGLDYETIGTVLRKNGVVMATATMAEVLGSPLRSVTWLARKLAGFGIELEAGDVILAGSPCAALDASAGDEFEVILGGIGRVGVSFG